MVLAMALTCAVVSAFAEDEVLIDSGRQAFGGAGCYRCHTIGKLGTPMGPDLSHVGARYSRAYLARWLRDPAAQRPSTHMPLLELSEEQVNTIAAFLSSLR